MGWFGTERDAGKEGGRLWRGLVSEEWSGWWREAVMVRTGRHVRRGE